MQFNSIDDILEFAISKEEGAATFYRQLAKKMEKPWIKRVFNEFAEEEVGHRRKLVSVKEGKYLERSKTKILDLKLADYLTVATPHKDMNYEEALIHAMKQEKESFRLYTELAAACDQADMKEMFLFLAQEEAKHKLRFELEYDEVMLK